MFLAFSSTATSPTHEVETLSALDMCTTTLDLANSYLTFRVWTQFSAFLQVQLREKLLILVVFNLNVMGEAIKFGKKINPVDHTSLKGVNVFFAV